MNGLPLCRMRHDCSILLLGLNFDLAPTSAGVSRSAALKPAGVLFSCCESVLLVLQRRLRHGVTDCKDMGTCSILGNNRRLITSV